MNIRRRHDRCECGDDLPGTCPGVRNCPYSSYEAPEDDDADNIDIPEDE